jgi:hydroxypyruvate isomerase
LEGIGMSQFSQAFSWWAFVNRGVEPADLLAAAARIGYAGVDLVDEELWPLVRHAGLRIAAISGHKTFGMNRRENAPAIEREIRQNLAKAEKWNISSLICFSGNRDGQTDAESAEICAETLARLAPAAADAGVTLLLEMLNSTVDHPGYQADSTEFGVRVCELAGSPSVRLLYDIYHMQVMEGDIIRTISRNAEWFCHYHTAGNPGRGQPDDSQEIYYPAIYRAIEETGFTGMISHEFVPKGDPVDALARAFADCAKA